MFGNLSTDPENVSYRYYFVDTYFGPNTASNGLSFYHVSGTDPQYNVVTPAEATNVTDQEITLSPQTTHTVTYSNDDSLTPGTSTLIGEPITTVVEDGVTHTEGARELWCNIYFLQGYYSSDFTTGYGITSNYYHGDNDWDNYKGRYPYIIQLDDEYARCHAVALNENPDYTSEELETRTYELMLAGKSQLDRDTIINYELCHRQHNIVFWNVNVRALTPDDPGYTSSATEGYLCYSFIFLIPTDATNSADTYAEFYDNQTYISKYDATTTTTTETTVIEEASIPEYAANVRLSFTWNNLPMVVMSPIASIVLTLAGVQLTQEIQPINIAQQAGSSLTSTIPVIENFYSMAQTLRDLHDELVVAKDQFGDTALYKLPIRSGQERTLTLSAKYITKDGTLHQIYIPKNGVFSVQLTFGVSYYFSS